jgi:hypothetical protein
LHWKKYSFSNTSITEFWNKNKRKNREMKIMKNPTKCTICKNSPMFADPCIHDTKKGNQEGRADNSARQLYVG